jgi:hypothetical protein
MDVKRWQNSVEIFLMFNRFPLLSLDTERSVFTKFTDLIVTKYTASCINCKTRVK